jgi:hypothetical protein
MLLTVVYKEIYVGVPLPEMDTEKDTERRRGSQDGVLHHHRHAVLLVTQRLRRKLVVTK